MTCMCGALDCGSCGEAQGQGIQCWRCGKLHPISEDCPRCEARGEARMEQERDREDRYDD